MSQDGRGISQLYAYDRDGKRLDDVRIDDQTGAPVLLDPTGTGNSCVDASGRTWANVCPGPAAEGVGWVVRDDTGAWRPPMAISPLRTKVPVDVRVDVLPNDGSISPGVGDPGATTEAAPSTSPTPTPTGSTTPDGHRDDPLA